MLNEISFVVNKGDKIVFVGLNGNVKLLLFDIFMGEVEVDSGEYIWGVIILQVYFLKDNFKYFDGVDMMLVDWLCQYFKDQDEMYFCGFLGCMFFLGEEFLKKVSVFFGGEKVCCMLVKMM